MDRQRLSFIGLTCVIWLSGPAARVMFSSLSAQQADVTRNPLGASAVAISDGQRLFDQTCQTCHGPAGQGGPGARGPALNAGSLSRAREDGDLFHTIRNGVQGSQMPPFRDLTDTQIWQLVSYIRSLADRSPGGSPGASPGGAPGAAGATARAVAAPAIVATLRDGREIRGIRRNEDTFSVQIMDALGQLHLLDKRTLAGLRVEDDRTAPDEPAVLSMSGGLTFDRLVNAAAEPHNWLMYWGNFQGTHYSPLKHIDAGNVRQLQLAWAFPMPGESVLEATPLVVDGVMYNTQPGAVVAIDARTGRQIWKYTRQQKVRSPYEINPFNRGAAVLGRRLFVGTLDAALVALDSRTGLPLWETQVADSLSGYSLTSAPLIVKDKVLVGITGGEFGARGFLDAYDAATGRRLWRWYAVPGPGEFGSETWPGESWKQGGSPMWLTGSYDPALNLVYWTVGNPAPQIDRSVRGDLDNLFSDSVVAIDPDTGQRKWHYQFTPNDGHDWDSCQDLVLVDRMWHGRMRKLLLHADRNGILYVIDRTDGTLLSGTPFVYVNWMTGFDASGRPMAVPGSNSSIEGSFFVYPTLVGGTNFQSPSYSPLTGWLYLEYSEGGQRYTSAPAPFEPGRQYIGRAPASAAAGSGRRPGEPSPSAGIKAVDPDSGRTMWDFKLFQGSLTNGVLATAGNVVFGASRDGNLLALDAKTGKHLWHVQTGGNMAASPMSYAVADRQYVAISAGNMIYAFALPEPGR
jgi:PQQ-dependent dehydrogenase (methanol/ethanol family)